MEKEFIPHKEALILKELGFNEPCLGYYSKDTLDNSIELLYGRSSYSPVFKENTPAPIYRQAFRFFREKYNLEGIPQRAEDRSWYKFHIYELLEDYKILISSHLEMSTEEVELACLRKLIEIVKER